MKSYYDNPATKGRNSKFFMFFAVTLVDGDDSAPRKRNLDTLMHNERSRGGVSCMIIVPRSLYMPVAMLYPVAMADMLKQI